MEPGVYTFAEVDPGPRSGRISPAQRLENLLGASVGDPRSPR
jgi:hypothetical protein